MIPLLLYVPPLLGVGRLDVKTVAAITMVDVFVGVPIRVTIGSSLAITALAAMAGVAGKLATHQVPLVPALLVALGALPGAQLGGLASQRLSGIALKRILFLVIALTGIRVWWDVLID